MRGLLPSARTRCDDDNELTVFSQLLLIFQFSEFQSTMKGDFLFIARVIWAGNGVAITPGTGSEAATPRTPESGSYWVRLAQLQAT